MNEEFMFNLNGLIDGEFFQIETNSKKVIQKISNIMDDAVQPTNEDCRKLRKETWDDIMKKSDGDYDKAMKILDDFREKYDSDQPNSEPEGCGNPKCTDHYSPQTKQVYSETDVGSDRSSGRKELLPDKTEDVFQPLSEVNYFTSGKESPKKLLKHCLVCGKKKGLIFNGAVGRYITQICNECLNEEDDVNEALCEGWKDGN